MKYKLNTFKDFVETYWVVVAIITVIAIVVV